MALTSSKSSLIWMTLCIYFALCISSPTRRQFVTITETTSDPAVVVTNEETVWDDNDAFDLDGDIWLNEAVVSPSTIPQHQDYDDYDDDEDDDDEYDQVRHEKVVVDFRDDEDTVEHQDAEEDDIQTGNESEFLFMPPRDTRLMLEDDDEQSGPIKVRHTGRSSYPRILDVDNSADSEEEKDSISRQFEFTVDDDDEDDDDKDKDDFVIEDSHLNDDTDNSVEVLPTREVHEDDIDDDDDDDDDQDDEDFAVEEDVNENSMFENPEEEAAQVIYGDHVFLY
ncbi:hypothetical protein X975_08309, partial [Stegodyphus mimosarum]